MIRRWSRKKSVFVGGTVACLVTTVVSLVFILTARPKNIILVTLDTTRADQISCNGVDKARTPRICDLASRSTWWTDAYSQSSWTLPSHASIMTGVYPHEHGAKQWQTPISQRFPMIAEVLKSRGYRTAAFVGTIYVGQKYGFDRGFESFNVLPYGDIAARAQEISDGALAWLASTEEPFFLWVHYYDPHHAFVRHKNSLYQYAADTPESLPYPKWNQIAEEHGQLKKEPYIDLYRGELAHVDLHLGRLFDFLASKNLADKTAVVITSDHGESFGEHNHAGHDHTVYKGLIHVPLVVHIPGQVPEIRSEVVETRQIAATILQQAGGKRSEWMAQALPFSEGAAFSDVHNRNRSRHVSIITGDRHLLYTEDKQLFELYAQTDTAQLKDLSTKENYDGLKKRLFERMNIVGHDTETLNQLKSLGYVN